ncbi:MAG: BTAD domain-containing putative transcriptional regulator [Ilumatobacteraceae bacterium]
MFSVVLLGPIELRRDGERVHLPGGKTTELLVRLALEAGGTVRSERLIDELWDDEAVSTAKNTLQSKVSQLRRALGDPALVVGGSAGYSLAIESSAVDALEVIRLAELTATLLRGGDASEAHRAGSAALALFRGEVLADAGDAEWLRPHRARLDEVHAQLIEDEIAARLELGAAHELIGELEASVAQYPLRERLRGQQMLALYRAGRQADALRAYQAARAVLADELGLEPGRELQRLESAILGQDPALDLPERHRGRSEARPESRTGNLPAAVSSFVGRVAELDDLCAEVSARRLVTLIGPGGAGKTRLGLEAASRLRASFDDGVWLIELAPVREGHDVWSAVASALGLDDSARLDAFVSERRILLVIDNCEHVIQDAAFVADRLLRAGSGVTILATSRERLGVTGELLYSVEPLSADDAAALFVERARAVGMAGADDDQAGTITRICEDLDRLPLALELAAARARSLSLTDIAERLGDRFGLLTGGDRTAQPRHQSLRGVVDWSYELLFTEEQRVFRQLSVFAGGFVLNAAQAVCASADVPSHDIADLIGNLVDKSLVRMSHHAGETRYTLLETLAEYGRGQLQAHDEERGARDRHLAWAVRFAQESEIAMRSAAQSTWVDRAVNERENIRAAVRWACEHGRADDAIAIVSGLAYAWYISGSIKESLPLLTAALATNGDTSAERRAVGEAWTGWMTQMAGGATTEAVERAERAVVLARPASSRAFALAVGFAAMFRAFRGLSGEADELVDEASARLEHEADRWGQAWIDWVRSGLVHKAGDPQRATELLRASVDGFAQLHDQCGTAIASIRLGELAELRGDYAEARSSTLFAYNAVMVSGAKSFNGSVLATRLGNIAALQGDFAEAAEWHELGLRRARDGEFPGAIAQAFSGMGEAARRSGGLGAAVAYHREALSRFEASGSIEGASFSLACLGLIATEQGDPGIAVDVLTKSLVKAHASSDQRGVAFALEGLAAASAAGDDASEAAVLLGAAAVLRERIGGTPPVSQRGGVDRAQQRACSQLGQRAYASEYARGSSDVAAIVAGLVSGGTP